MAAQLLSGGQGNASLISALQVTSGPHVDLLAFGTLVLLVIVQGHLEGMIGKPSGLIESLPKTLRNRLAYLGTLQDQHDEVAEQLHEEQVALQRKYEKLWGEFDQLCSQHIPPMLARPPLLHTCSIEGQHS